jgi:membrane-associated phospholipid phosphatase
LLGLATCRPSRRWAFLAGIGLAAAAFAVLGHQAREGHVLGWDRAIWSFLYGHEKTSPGSVPDRAANAIVESGGTAATVVLGLVLVAILVVRRRIRDALFVIATGVAVLTLTPLIKEPFERADLKYSYPSGHAAASAALVAAAVIVAWPTRLRWPTLVVGGLFAVILGLALVYEDWHLPSDILGGWCLAFLCAGGIRAALGAPDRGRRAQPQPPRTPCPGRAPRRAP